ncbi:MAG: signal peptide peptidase SppA, partial [Myxococcota bacterium]
MTNIFEGRAGAPAHRGAVALAAVAAVLAALGASPDPAAAQNDDRRYADRVSRGLLLPTAALSGEHDVFSTISNPAGLPFVGGLSLGLALAADDEDSATSAGAGAGLFLSYALGGTLLPKFSLGLGLEFLRPSRVALSPDPGTPTRTSVAVAVPFGRSLALGASWHRFYDDPDRLTSGLGTWDVGLSARFGTRWAMGAVVRDVGAPVIRGIPVQRQYELEVLSRPLATDRFEAAIGGRVGETRGDLGGWLRVSARVARGLYVQAAIESRELQVLTATDSFDEREWVASAGLEISLGGVDAGIYGTGARADGGDTRLASGTLLLRTRSLQVPSVLGQRQRVERIEVSGPIGDRRLTGLVLRMRGLSRDDAVVGVVLQIDRVAAGWATVKELRDQILALRKAGKKVFAYLVSTSTRDYFLASAADRIYLDPAGNLRLVGFSATAQYIKNAFDMLGVTAQFIKIAEYKSAPEQYTHDAPTGPARQMRDEVYDSIYSDLLAAIAESRGLSQWQVRQLLDGGPYSPGDLGTVVVENPGDGATAGADGARAAAASQGGTSGAETAEKPAVQRTFGDVLKADSPLIDAIAGPEQLSVLIARELGGNVGLGRAPRERPERWTYPGIAVIYISGEIATGNSRTTPLIGRRVVGGDTIAQAIAAARASPQVAAIVVRIDSGGGSALASELMAREVFKTRGVKPIICSLGDVAASGGYFAAAGCDTILAESMTVTGSIGIFAGKFDMSQLLARLGLSWSIYKRGQSADMESFYRPYSDRERTMVERRIRYFYNRFIDAVAVGRGMTRAQVDAIGRGRVWSGRQAVQIGLVDQLGGLSAAITLAKTRIGLGDDDRVRIIALPRSQSNLLGR